MRLFLLVLLVAGSCTFDPKGIPTPDGQKPQEDGVPDANPPSDAMLPDAGLSDAMLPDAGLPDAMLPLCATSQNYQPKSNGRRYRISTQGLHWQAANALCSADGAHLATINNPTENGILRGSLVGFFWIGLNDIGQEGVFEWADGSAVNYTRWRSNEPNGGTQENCVEVLHTGRWNDQACTDDNKFVCECPLP